MLTEPLAFHVPASTDSIRPGQSAQDGSFKALFARFCQAEVQPQPPLTGGDTAPDLPTTDESLQDVDTPIMPVTDDPAIEDDSESRAHSPEKSAPDHPGPAETRLLIADLAVQRASVAGDNPQLPGSTDSPGPDRSSLGNTVVAAVSGEAPRTVEPAPGIDSYAHVNRPARAIHFRTLHAESALRIVLNEAAVTMTPTERGVGLALTSPASSSKSPEIRFPLAAAAYQGWQSASALPVPQGEVPTFQAAGTAGIPEGATPGAPLEAPANRPKVSITAPSLIVPASSKPHENASEILTAPRTTALGGIVPDRTLRPTATAGAAPHGTATTESALRDVAPPSDRAPRNITPRSGTTQTPPAQSVRHGNALETGMPSDRPVQTVARTISPQTTPTTTPESRAIATGPAAGGRIETPAAPPRDAGLRVPLQAPETVPMTTPRATVVLTGLPESAFAETHAADRTAVTGYAETLQPSARPGAAAPPDSPGSTGARVRDIGQQIAVRIVEHGPGRLSIGLAPAELGRVEITILETDRGLNLAILAERPETLDLMRRHLGMLAQEMRAFGLEGMSLQLGGSGGGADKGAGGAIPCADHDRPAPERAASQPAPPTPSAMPATDDHLDIRV